MAETNGRNQSPLGMIMTFIVVIIIPLAIGIYLAPRAVPEPKVGVIRLSTDIFSTSAFEITEQLAYAREDDSVRAVVLVINSPGGSAVYSEELYLDVLNTRSEVPVIASIDLLAASGAYFMAAAADAIYAKPTSSVGSIGVISFLPGEVFIEEELLTTGPYKAFGGTRDSTVRQIERAKFAFLESVKAGRGSKLRVGDDVLTRAEIYSGIQALEFGLVDDLIATDEAIQAAADLAGLSKYEVVELYPLTFDEEGQSFVAYQPAPVDVEALWAVPTNLPPGLYYRYFDLPHGQ